MARSVIGASRASATIPSMRDDPAREPTRSAGTNLNTNASTTGAEVTGKIGDPGNTSDATPHGTRRTETSSRVLAAIAGVVAAAVALGTGELIAGLTVGAPSPLISVGTALIDFAPPGSKEIVVSLFGTNDKPALEILVGLVVLLIGAGVGVLARTRFTAAASVIVAIVAVGLLASLRLPLTSATLALVSAALQAGLALLVLNVLLDAARPARDAGTTGHEGAGREGAVQADRRGFLVRAGVLGGLAVVGGGFGRQMLENRATQATTASAEIPQAVDPAPAPDAAASLDVQGLGPVVTPNDSFYRIDTSLITPAIDLASWRLKVTGMVDREVTLSFDDLVQLPLTERYVTIACVSNEVGGHLVGNAKWTGVRLVDVLDMAGVQAGATQIVPRSADGWTAGFPTAWLTDPAHPRDALIAVKMNDAPLPAEHGFPARLIVPGLYGYVSATKWVTEIELTTLEAWDAYWVPRGWAKEAPILTQSRIDVPRSGASVKAGPVAVAGVAWAPDRGIEKVEVSVDDGAWETATLADEISPTTWVQWKWAWQATAGQHTIAVRATDGTGEIQTATPSSPAPDGARGYHMIAVQVS
jgi:DMSO/TMAO reductase YedYZ molybdopterin-dependent catalytic subunit